MKLQFRTLICLLILPALMVANHDKFKGKYTKEKTVKKEFTVNKDAVLKVSNSYGNVDVVTWNENRTVIEVRIKTNSDSEENAQKKLEEITIEFSGTASLVTAKTLFGNKKDSWSFWGDGHKNVSMEINYIVKLPRTNSVELNNDYGAISLDKLEGTAKINCDYGQLLIGELMADNNILRFDYTSKSTIAYMKSGKINADYSSFTLEKGDKIELNADYTQSEFKEVQDITYNCDYGKVEIEKARNISGRGDYLTNRIGSVSGSLSLNTDYGSIKVDRLTGSAKSVTIDADYTGIKLGFARDYSFSFNVELTYCGLGGEETVTITNKSVESNRKTYSGYRGSDNSGNLIKINSDYGGVTFIEN